MPRKGPVVVVVNHASHLDPPLVGIAFTSRALCYMAKKELWEKGLLGWFLTQIAAIPVARDAQEDRRTFMTAVRRLRDGEPVLLFPEGTRSSTGVMQPFQIGAAAIAASVPGTRILPVLITGAYDALPPKTAFARPKKIRIKIGPSFSIDELKGLPQEKKALYRAVTNVMFERISSL